MSILELLPVTSMLDRPFSDYLNVTFPLDIEGDVRGLLTPIIESLGFFDEVDEGVYRLYDSRLKPTRGVIKFSRRGKVAIVSLSGAALSTLRQMSLFDEFLSTMAVYPHRVSMLHATQDYVVPNPPAVILAVKDAGFSESISLTRKRVLKENVKAFTSPDHHGHETGTIYLGNRSNADVWAKVYDKRHERISRGFPDPGPIIRVEVAVQSDIGATLKDAHNPFSIFFHFAGRSLVEVPPTFKGWKAAGEGYVLGTRQEILPFQRLERFVENSLAINRLVDLSIAAYGRRSGAVLGRLFQKRCDAALGAV